MCPAARERKRQRQRVWVCAKYWNNPEYRKRKQESNELYKMSAAGMLSRCNTGQNRLALEVLLQELPREIAAEICTPGA